MILHLICFRLPSFAYTCSITVLILGAFGPSWKQFPSSVNFRIPLFSWSFFASCFPHVLWQETSSVSWFRGSKCSSSEGRCGRENSVSKEEACFLWPHTLPYLKKKKRNFPKYKYHMELLIWNSSAHRNSEWLKLNPDRVYNLNSPTVYFKIIFDPEESFFMLHMI